MDFRIKQGVAKVVNSNGSYFWIRVSRSSLRKLANRWQNTNGFYYMKIYEFNRKTRVTGRKLAWINREKYGIE